MQSCDSANRYSTHRTDTHTLRHTTAMHLLQSGVDVTVIALWLGHESPATTHMYIEADLAMKKRALDKLAEPRARAGRGAGVLGRPVITRLGAPRPPPYSSPARAALPYPPHVASA